MQKIVMTKSQIKILIAVGIITMAFVVFVAAVYLPMKRRLAQVKSELAELEYSINQVKAAAGTGVPLEQAIGSIRSKLEEFDKKFPDKEEVILRELSELAAAQGIEVLSLRPQKKRDVKDVGGVVINIKDSVVQEMPISMSLRTTYKRLGEFFRILDENFPVFVRVDSVIMAKSGGSQSGLIDVELNMNTYLISPGAT